MVRAPGIYFEKADLARRPASVRTDVAGIVGFAARGPVGVPVPLDSNTQFETLFGAPREDLHLGWAVRAFFENGGIRAWVCRAASPEARASDAVIEDSSGPAFRIQAASPGGWGDALTLAVIEASAVETLATGAVVEGRAVAVAGTSRFAPGDLLRITQPDGFSALRVINTVDHADSRIIWASGDPASARGTDALLTGFDPGQPILLTRLRYTLSVSRRGVFAASYPDLGIVPGGPRFIADVLTGTSGLLTATDLRGAASGPVAALLPLFEPVVLRNGRDGLATLRPADLLSALRGFDLIDEPAIFLIPDLHEPAPLPELRPVLPAEPGDPCIDCPPVAPPPALTPKPRSDSPPGFTVDEIARVQQALLEWCAARDSAFAVLDMPRQQAMIPSDTHALLAWRRRFDSPFGAIYYPWIRVPRADRTLPTRPTPAAGHVAGQMAATDLAVGVHKAPANRRLVWAQEATLAVTPELHAHLNDAGINVIRTTPSRGLRVMGARTLSTDPVWPFVPVRRLMSMIGYALKLSSRWAIFEPNDHGTRAKLASVYAAYLTALWRRGGLAGGDPSEAFFVRPEPAEDEAGTGRLTTTVGVAPLDPLEFIVFRVGREEGAISVETSPTGRILGAA